MAGGTGTFVKYLRRFPETQKVAFSTFLLVLPGIPKRGFFGGKFWIEKIAGRNRGFSTSFRSFLGGKRAISVAGFKVWFGFGKTKKP